MKSLFTLPDSSPGYAATGLRVGVIRPKERTNHCVNPSAELATTGWASTGASAPTRSAEWQAAGTYSLKHTPSVITAKLYFTAGLITVTTLGSKTIGVSFSFKGQAGYKYRAVLGFGIILNPLGPSTTKEWVADGRSQRITFIAQPDTTATDALQFYVMQITGSTLPAFYVDALLIEDISSDLVTTTYFDGDFVGMIPTRKDYYWTGVAHASTSVRTAEALGGYETSLNDLGFQITSTIGLGMYTPTPVLNAIGRGQQFYSDSLVTGRTFSLLGKIYAKGGVSELRRIRANLEETLQPLPPNPLWMRFYLPDKRILNAKVVYRGGLEGNTDNAYQENLALNFETVDAFFTSDDWYAYEGVVGALTNSTAVMQRTRNGVWTNTGAGISGGVIVNIEVSKYSNVPYAVGAFTNKAAYYSRATDTWTVLDGVNPPDDTVNDIDFSLDGLYAYIVGKFLNAGGIAALRAIQYNIATGTWTSMTSTLNGEAFAACVDPFGRVYVGGNFTTPDNYVARYNGGGSWSALTGDPGSICYDLVNGPSPLDYSTRIYAACASSVQYYDVLSGSGWTNMGNTTGGIARKLLYAPDGKLYCFGSYTAIGGVTAPGKAYWNGSRWIALGSTSDNHYDAVMDFEGRLVVRAGGSGGMTFPFWNGYRWVVNDYIGDFAWIDNPAGLAVDNDGNMFASYARGAFTMTGDTTGLVSINNVGTEAAELEIAYQSDVTSIRSIINYTNKKIISIPSLAPLIGRVIIRCTRRGVLVYSNTNLDYSRIISQGSDTDFFLEPGVNQIGLLIIGSSTGTSIAYRPTYKATDLP